MYSVIDLFAGAGGLSLGFKQTKKFDIKVAFENSPDMQATYKKNHPTVKVMGDVCVADYSSIKEQYGKIDVVIGGPPCQGFSNANRQKKNVISQNNMLVKQFIRAILELQPKAFVMENVSMLKSDVHRFFLSDSDIEVVDKYKIPFKETNLLLLEKPFIFDDAISLINDRSLICQNLWPERHYSELNVIYKASKNKTKLASVLNKHKLELLSISQGHALSSTNNDINSINESAVDGILRYYSGEILETDLVTCIEPAIMIQRMLSKAKEILDNHIIVERYDCSNGIVAVIKSFAVYDYLTAILQSEENGYVITNDVLCAADYGAPQKRMRFVAMGIKKSVSKKVALPRAKYDSDEYFTVRDAVFDLENIDVVYDLQSDVGKRLESCDNLSCLAAELRDSDILYNHIATKTTDVALQRFKALKQGQNFHDLSNELKTNTYTDISRTQNTIYSRLNYDEPSGTVVNVRKSMWVHPTLNRAISVREAARLQTFPDSFVFCGSKDKQYQQVGNAVPPIMAKAVAKKLASILDKSEANNE